jgi:hypothetical protein
MQYQECHGNLTIFVERHAYIGKPNIFYIKHFFVIFQIKISRMPWKFDNFC